MISQIYTNKEIIIQMNNYFKNNNFIRLDNFLNLEKKQNLENLKFEKFEILDFKKCNFLNLEKTKNPFISSLFDFFNSSQFFEFFEKITKQKITKIDIKFVKYEKEDYSIINDEFKLENKFDIILDFTKKKSSNLIYLTKKEEKLKVESNFNCLTIIKLNKNLMKYQKYLNCEMEKILRFEISII
jgi:hypothetical protein